MTYQSSLAAAGPAAQQVDVTIVIDGIPVLFGTKAGMVVNTTSWFNNGPNSMTSVEAFDRGGLTLSGSELNFDQLIVQPSGATVRLRSSPAWDKYFQRRRTPRTRLISSVDYNDTTFSVESSSGFAIGDVVYINREACLVGGVSSPGTLSSMTRQYAQLKNGVPGNHGAGALVQATPNYLAGRMAEVWFHAYGQTYLERRLFIDSVKWSGSTGTWEISFSDMMSMLERPIAVGFEPRKVTGYDLSATATSPSFPTMTFGLDTDLNVTASVSLPNGNGLHAVIKNGESRYILPVQSVSGDDVTVRVGSNEGVALFNELSNLVGGSTSGFYDANRFEITVGLCYKLERSPVESMLRVLLSERGDGYNHPDFDTLCGSTTAGASGIVALAEGEEEHRFGAGVTEALIDTTTLDTPEFMSLYSEGWCYWLGIGGQETLRDFIEEVAWASQCYFCIRDGKFSLKPINGISNIQAAQFTLDDTSLKNILKTSSLDAIDDESEVVHSIGVECNLDPFDNKLKGRVNLRDGRYYDVYKDSAKPLKLQRRGLRVDVPSALVSASNDASTLSASVNSLIARLDRTLHRRMRGMRKYSMRLPFRYHVYGPGDIALVSTDTLPAFDGNTLSSQALEVISVGGVDLASGTVEFQFADSWATKIISPTSVLTAWNGGTSTMTLATNHRYGGGTEPGTNLWGVGWKVRILSKATTSPPFSSISGLLTITAATATTITVSGTVTITPAAGDLLVQATYDDATSTVEVGGAAQRGHVFLADANGRLGSSDASSDEWG